MRSRRVGTTDAEAGCIICNWANNVLWPYFGLGAIGAAAAAAAAGGLFGGAGRYSGGGADDAGAVQTPADERVRPPGDLNQRARETVEAFSEDATRLMFGERFLEPRGTLFGGGSGSGPSTHYDADYVGRDYKNDPVEPPAPRDS